MNSERRGLVAGAGWLALASLTGCAAPAEDGHQRVAFPRPSLMSDMQAGEAAFLALGLVGTPYRYGGNTPETGFDCSGLIGYVYSRSAGISTPRTVAQISRWGQSVGASDLRAGDLVIFGTDGSPSHAAIHAGESRFVHAPSTGGTVRLNRINERYWKARLLDYRRA
ncbi:MAG: C40 family peptidase [Ramlibacter sp.]